MWEVESTRTPCPAGSFIAGQDVGRGTWDVAALTVLWVTDWVPGSAVCCKRPAESNTVMLQSVTLLKRKLFLYKGLLLVSLPELNASWPRLTGYLGSQPPAVALSGGGGLMMCLMSHLSLALPPPPQAGIVARVLPFQEGLTCSGLAYFHKGSPGQLVITQCLFCFYSVWRALLLSPGKCFMSVQACVTWPVLPHSFIFVARNKHPYKDDQLPEGGHASTLPFAWWEPCF